MSDCLIKITINGKEITLDPGSDITSKNQIPLSNSISSDNLRTLYNQLKGTDVFKNMGRLYDSDLIETGETLYNEQLKEAGNDGKILTVLGSIMKEKDQVKLKQLTAYASSLDASQVLEHGNFMINPSLSYMASPYTVDDIRNLVFNSNSNEIKVFNNLMKVSGMETTKISLAYARTWNGESLEKVKGAYISPDGIIQIVIPSRNSTYEKIVADVTNVTKQNITNQAKKEVRDVLLHELAHAVYSELYYANSTFKSKVDQLHSQFLKSIASNKAIADTYKDVHEFIASGFNNKPMQILMSKIKTKNNEIETSTVFNDFKSIIDNNLLQDSNLLNNYIDVMSTSLNTLGVTDVINVADNEDKQNIFYIGDVSQDEVDDNMSPTDQTENYSAINRKAFYASKRFNKRYNAEDSFLRDSFYKTTELTPNNAQIDNLRADDVIITPWLQYSKAVYDNTGKRIKDSSWIELAGVYDKAQDSKNAKQVLDSKGQPLFVPMVRDEAGKPVKSKQGYLHETNQSFPVLYSNIKKDQVTVAKSKLSDKDEFNGKDKFNTFAIPYNLIKGIRRLDRSYFNHNDNYEEQLSNVKDEAKKVSGENDKAYFDADFYKTRIQQLENNISKSQAIKAEIAELNKKYTYSREVDGIRLLNLSQADYIETGAKPTDKHAFSEDPIYKIQPYTTAAGKKSFITYPDFNKFEIFWNEDLGSHYAATAESVSGAIGKGDLLKINKPQVFTTSEGEKVSVAIGQWMVVYNKVGNGIQVTTENGKGLIIPFKSITAYAKNKTTPEHLKAILTYHSQNEAFRSESYIKGTNQIDKSVISYKSLIYNPTFNSKVDDDQEAAITKFDDSVVKLKALITPNETFVRVARRYVDNNDVINTFTNSLVLAKNDTSLVLYSELKGAQIIEVIPFDSRLTTDNGKQITHILESTAKAKEVYDKFAAQTKQFEENKKTVNWKSVNGIWTKENETRFNPQNIKDAYDFYDDINGKTIQRITEGSLIAIYYDKSKMDPTQAANLKQDYFYRPAIRVTEDGKVVVAGYRNNDIKLDNNFILKGGRAYATYIPMERIAKIGFNITDVKENENGDIVSDNEALIARRKLLWENSQRDRDYNAYKFATFKAAEAFNNKYGYNESKNYDKYIPLTSDIANIEGEKTYLNRNLNKVSNIEDAAFVMAKFNQGSNDMKFIYRGIMTQSNMLYKDNVTFKDSNQTSKFRKELLDKVLPGDWVSMIKKDGSFWDSLIERVEGDNIYTLNTDLTTTRVVPDNIRGIRLSNRNEQFSNYTRFPNLDKLFKTNKAIVDASQEKLVRERQKNSGPTDSNLFSLEFDFKAPQISRRAIFEIGNRLKNLNPEIDINYVEKQDIRNLALQTGYDYSKARAFILKGDVYINMDKASVSDVVHEYAHLFLHSLKVENVKLYNAIISMTNNHPLFNTIAYTYNHLEGSDLDEEVFVSILGEYLGGKMKPSDVNNMSENRDTILDFASFTREKLSKALNREITNVQDIKPEEILTMSLEDVINVLGDQLMNNKITDLHQDFNLRDNFSLDIFKKELYDKGLLSQECYG